MPNIAFSDARVKAFAPRRSVYDIRDAELRGFGLRVLPSGTKRFFVHAQRQGERIWRIVGDANTMTVGKARTLAAALLTAFRRRTDSTTAPEDTRFETVAESVFQRQSHSFGHAESGHPNGLRAASRLGMLMLPLGPGP